MARRKETVRFCTIQQHCTLIDPKKMAIAPTSRRSVAFSAAVTALTILKRGNRTGVSHAAEGRTDSNGRGRLRVRLKRVPLTASGMTAFVTVRELTGQRGVIGSDKAIIAFDNHVADDVLVDVAIDVTEVDGGARAALPLAVSARVDVDGDALTRSPEDLVGRAEYTYTNASEVVVSMRGRGLAGRFLTTRQ